MWMLLAIGACTDGQVESTPEASPFDSGWIADVVNDPAQFSSRIAANREGWIALHQHDWSRAIQAGGDPAARAHAELALFYDVLGETNDEAWERLSQRWSKRQLPNADLVAQFAEAAAQAMIPTAESSQSRLAAGAGAERWAVHAEARNTGNVHGVIQRAKTPLVQSGSGLSTQQFYDPWIFETMRSVAVQQGATQPPQDERLFSAAIASGQPFELPPLRGPNGSNNVEDATACREAVRSFDSALSAWELSLSARANVDGRALLSDLRMVAATRSAALTGMAWLALGQDRPACALALTQLALDHEAPRSISPVNSPTLFAVAAAAQLQLGHSREALDALEVLVSTFPPVAPLDETIGTLVVLDGLDRNGESRE